MLGKNSPGGTCQKKFCPVGGEDEEYESAETESFPKKKFQVLPKNDQTTTKQTISPKDDQGDYSIIRQVDPSTINRNRELRRQKEEAELRRTEDIRTRYQKNIVAGPAEQARIRLIYVISQYQSKGMPYCVVSQYFDDCFKPLEKAGDQSLDVFREILVYDRDALKNSDSCYANALAGLQKLRSNTFGPIVEIVEGLATAIGLK